MEAATIRQIQSAYVLNGAVLMVVKTTSCPDAFQRNELENQCIFHSKVALNFTEASAKCEAMGEF